MTNAPAGWYPDPDEPGTQRFWDGREWLDTPMPSTTVPSSSTDAANYEGAVNDQTDLYSPPSGASPEPASHSEPPTKVSGWFVVPAVAFGATLLMAGIVFLLRRHYTPNIYLIGSAPLPVSTIGVVLGGVFAGLLVVGLACWYLIPVRWLAVSSLSAVALSGVTAGALVMNATLADALLPTMQLSGFTAQFSSSDDGRCVPSAELHSYPLDANFRFFQLPGLHSADAGTPVTFNDTAEVPNFGLSSKDREEFGEFASGASVDDLLFQDGDEVCVFPLELTMPAKVAGNGQAVMVLTNCGVAQQLFGDMPLALFESDCPREIQSNQEFVQNYGRKYDNTND